MSEQTAVHSALLTLLGGRRRLGAGNVDPVGLARMGLPADAYQSLIQWLGLTVAEQAQLFGVAPRSVSRLPKRKKPLNRLVSDRALRVARIGAELMYLWDSDEVHVQRWLREPNQALENETPLALMDTDAGIREVENVVNHIKYGVVA